MAITNKQQLIIDYLCGIISAGMQEGDLLPTVNDISKILKISQMTIIKAMDIAVKQELIYKIQGKGSFVGSQFRNPKFLKISNSEQKKTIAFISPFAGDDIFMRDFTTGVVEGVNNNRFSLICKHVRIPMMKEEDVIEETITQASGIVLMSHLTPALEKILKHLKKIHFPVVFMDHYPLDIPCTAVCTDNADGSEVIMNHLYDLGHRNILHISIDNGYSSSIERKKAYELFMNKHDLSPETIFADEKGIQGLDWFFDNFDENSPTAIFAQNDGLAIEVYNCLKQKGIRVPEQVSVAGFNDDINTDLFEVPLTTLAQPKKRIGAKSVQIMQSILDGENNENCKYFIQGELKIRNSTAVKISNKYEKVV